MKVELPPVTVNPFCRSAFAVVVKPAPEISPDAVMSAPLIFENVTLSVVPSCRLFLASISVPAPVPPDAIANGVDRLSIAVESVFVFAS